MTSAAPIARMTYQDYLTAEAAAGRKHEYVHGEVFAMAGGTPEHGALAMTVGALLVVALRDRPCRVFNSDVRLRIHASDVSTYPDLSVVCGQLERASDDPDAIVNPIILVEVLSSSTEAYDRGEKAAHYRRIPSLQEYCLVSQHQPRLELFRRNPDGRWEFVEAGPGQVLELASVGASLAVDEVYRNPL
jgi:Uma2 family endonuclease